MRAPCPTIRPKTLLPLTLAILFSASSARAQTLIAGWDFQTATTGGTAAAAAPGSPSVFNANFGSGTIYLNNTNGASAWVTATTGNEVTAFAGTAVNAGAGFSTTTTTPACLALLGGASGTASNGKFMVFRFSMSGKMNLVVSYATQRTATGYSAQTWEYSTNGSTWSAVQIVNSIPASFATTTLTTVTGLNNAANAYLRFSGTGASTAAGNNRLDNIQLMATADSDGDGVADAADNCPSNANANQFDSDSDGAGDACDACEASTGLSHFNYTFCIASPGFYSSTTLVNGVTVVTGVSACNSGCATCSGPGANQCLSCPAGSFLSGGTCLPNTAALTVARSGAGSGTITSNPAGIDCGATCAHDFTGGTSVALSATATTGSVFTGWSGACSGSSCSVTMSQPRSVTATFDLDSDGDGIGDASDACQAVTGLSHFTYGICQSDAGYYATTTPINGVTVVTAVNACSSSCATCNGAGSNQCQSCPLGFFLSGQTCVPNTNALTVARSGGGSGTITSNPAGILCGATCSNDFTGGTSVVLTATASTGSLFTGWGGDCAGSAASSCTLTMDQVRTVSVTFELDFDGDLLPDYLDPDDDDDGLSDLEETLHTTNPLDADSDDDGLSDGFEVHTSFTDPLDSDSDNDLVLDGADGCPLNGAKSSAGQCGCTADDTDTDLDTFANCIDDDDDGDGLSDDVEALHGTNPLLQDTDSDGLRDDVEVFTTLTNPLDDDSDDDTVLDGVDGCPLDAALTTPATPSVSVALSVGGSNPTCHGSAVSVHPVPVAGGSNPSYSAEVKYPGTLSFVPLQLDVDGNGSFDALTDGLIIVRYLMTSSATCVTSPTATSPDFELTVQPQLTWHQDSDGDGFYAAGSTQLSCTSPGNDWSSSSLLLAGDCDDGCASCNPASIETCDDKDNDCDGALDESCDDDNDNYCDGAMSVVGTSSTCPLGGGDCDDADGATHPGAFEICGDGVDQDCSGGDCAASVSVTVHASTGVTVVSSPPGLLCSSGTCQASFPLGTVLTLTATTSSPDVQFTGWSGGGCSGTGQCVCTVSSTPLDVTALSALRLNVSATPGGQVSSTPSGIACGAQCSAFFPSGSTVQLTATASPGFVFKQWTGACSSSATTSCALDLDFAPLTFSAVFEADADGDGFGVSTDCDDAHASVHTGAAEVCDGVDDDCDGVMPLSELDVDGDHFVSCPFSAATWLGSPAVASGDDCDDNCASCNPASAETCDDKDNDCDGALDESCDDDNDNYCDGAMLVVGTPSTCPLGGGDCDDSRTDVHPNGLEVCDASNADEDCDGLVDEGNPDTDGDALADCVDQDDDNDLVLDLTDNCPLHSNPGQRDSDLDGSGDACDDCPALSSVSSNPLFDASTCGAFPGSFVTLDVVVPGGLSVITDVTTCPAGSSCAGALVPRASCPAGTYSSLTGQTTCASCTSSSSTTPGASACVSYPGSPYCRVGTATPVVDGGGGGGGFICTSSNAASLVLDPVSGAVDLQLSLPGLYDVCLPQSSVCTTITINAEISSSITISVTDGSASTCSGSPVTVTADAIGSGGGGGGGAVFVWRIGSDIVQSGSNHIYIFGGQGSGGSLSCAMTSSATCASPPVAFSNAISLSVTPSVSIDLSSLSVTVTGGSNPTCSGTPVQLTAIGHFSDGGSFDSRPPGEMSFVWSSNGSVVGSNNPLYTDPATTGSNPLFEATSSRSCLTGPSTVISPPLELVVNPSVSLSTPVVSLSGGTNPTCSGSSVDFTVTGTYSDGSTYDSDVSYVWSTGAGTIPSGALLSLSAPVSGPVSVSVTSSRACSSTTPVSSSNSIDLAVTPVLSIVPSSMVIEQTLGSPSTCSGSDMQFHLSGLYSDGSSASNDLSATWTNGALTITGQSFGFSASLSSLSVSASSVTSSRSCVSNSGSVAAPVPFALSVSAVVSLSSVTMELSSGANPTCSGTAVEYRAIAHYSDGSSSDSRPPAEMHFDFFSNGALVQSSTNPLYSNPGFAGENPLFVSASSSRPCVASPSSLSSPSVVVLVVTPVDYALDVDLDNFYVTSSVVSSCSPPSSLHRLVSVMVSNGGGAGDCDDSRASVHPLAVEQCDNLDNDCSSSTAIDFTCDDDNDGYCDFSLVTVGTPSTCLSGGGDCDDTDSSRHPGALEVCDGVDQDCDATADDGLATLDYALDVDLDNFYVTSSVVSSCSPPSSLHRLVSVMVSNGGGAGDCDDSRASVHPLAVEQCDNLDNDCSSSTAIDFTCDDDNDGYCDFSLVTVGTPSTCLSGGGDCDDDRSSVFPGAPELCDGMRNNCSSSSIPSGELDDDGDGYVECAFVAATWGGSVLVFGGNDCDDLSASRHPGATETCDGVDQDCDAAVDEGSNVFYRDLDSDGYGDLVVSVSLVCTSPPSGFVVTPGDCDDTRLLYADVDGDGIGAGAPTACGVQTNTDNCPTVQGQVGSSCSDGNPSTTGDVLTASCQCVGTTTVTCTQNAVTLSLTTDAFGSQTSYDIVASGSTTAVCSGSGLVSGSTLTASCCLPNGCYDLRVFDSFGDGMALPGGFVLRDASSNRIIDNAGNGHGFSVISQSPLGFCVPLGTDRLMPTSCDVVNATTNTVLRAELNSTVTSLYSVGHPNNAITGYQFWITNPNGGFSRRIVLTHAAPGTGAPGGTPAAQKASFFKLSSMSSTPPAIPLEILLNVRVRAYIAGAYGEFGPACRLYLPPVPCQTTQLTTTADPVVSCGASGLVFSSVIYSTALSSATGYQFEFSKPGYLRRINSATRSVPLSFITVPLQYNSCYRVRVRVSFDGGLTYCPFGPYCNITLGTATCASGMALEDGTDGSSIADEARLSIWPNPNDGSLMNISFTGFDPTVSTVQVDVADLFGKLVSTRTIPVQDGYLNTAMSFEQQPAPGLYLVQLLAGDQRLTQRLVIE